MKSKLLVMTYNSERFISDCLNSLILSAKKLLDECNIHSYIYLHDHNSSDNTVALSKRILDQAMTSGLIEGYSFAVPLKSGEKVGKIRNSLLKLAYYDSDNPDKTAITFIDGDDIVTQDSLLDRVTILATRPSVGIATGYLKPFSNDFSFQKTIKAFPTHTELLPLMSLFECSLYVSNCTFRLSSALQDGVLVEFPEESVTEDWDFFQKLNGKVRSSKTITLLYRRHGSNLTSSKNTAHVNDLRLKSRLLASKKLGIDLDKNKLSALDCLSFIALCIEPSILHDVKFSFNKDVKLDWFNSLMDSSKLNLALDALSELKIHLYSMNNAILSEWFNAFMDGVSHYKALYLENKK